jgi:hypothetical protein
LNFNFISKHRFQCDFYWCFSLPSKIWNRLKHPELSRTKTNKTTNKLRRNFASKRENVHQNSELFEGLIFVGNRFKISAPKSKAAGQDFNFFQSPVVKHSPSICATDTDKFCRYQLKFES